MRKKSDIIQVYIKYINTGVTSDPEDQDYINKEKYA